ncbi:serine/threonine-protein kinase [Umezawaea beigongshangensis]|uniref:serine/threonine-protein kinase n=1 Tax=Umezawaea beigongshangensis TaxID=2780383 RepID=UPI0027DC2EB5|nr:protein kinase [Umezawaea beigongshangensis]
MGLAADLLAWLFGVAAVPLCPGDWAWTTTAFGAAVGTLPTVAALLSIVVRRVVGNSYGPASGTVFAVLGVTGTLILPWVLFSGARAALDLGNISSWTNSIDESFCGIDMSQRDYLLNAPSAAEVVSDPGSAQSLFAVATAITGALAVLCLLFVMMQAGSAFRLGPSWPRRFFWPPFLVLLLVSCTLPVTLVGHLLLGFFPIALLGSLLVRLFGLSTAVLNRPGRDRSTKKDEQPPLPRTPQQSGARPLQNAAKPPPYQPAPPSHRPVTAVPPPYQPSAQTPVPQQGAQSHHYPPTRVAGARAKEPTPTRVEPPSPAQPPLSKLADTPGPLPFGLGGSTPVPPVAPVGDSGAVWNPASGRFRRVRQIGSGGFGSVWLAVDTQLDRTVAVKLAHAPDADTEQRMQREARALAAVHHPNCVRVYDIVQDVNGLAIVMEFIDGKPLSEVVAQSGLLADQFAARLWVNMADALVAAHEKGVLHRDVKPSNVIVDGNGTAHLIDFGIARSRGDQTLTAAGMMVGTPDFLAPETARGEEATPSSDAWQLAATVSYALSGQPPRGERENAISALMAAARGEPNVKLPQNTAHHRLLVAALDADPARRPPLSAVRTELSSWLARQGLSKEGPVTSILPVPDPPTRPAH